jgi:hypothetical protein
MIKIILATILAFVSILVFSFSTFAEQTFEGTAEYFFDRAYELHQENQRLKSRLNNLEQTFVLGATVHYSPTAGEFVKGYTKWTYLQDLASFGIYSIIPVGEEGEVLYLKDRLIFGSGDVNTKVGLVGNITEVNISLNNFIVIHYECSYYWGGDKMSPIYGMCSEVSHRLGFDVNIPIIGYDYREVK